MNVMREIERMNARELELGIAESASWHADYAHSAYVFMGGLDYELTEGDIICLASQSATQQLTAAPSLAVRLPHSLLSPLVLALTSACVGCALCLLLRFGEVVDCNLVRDKTTGRSRGFCFVAYEDQRSCVLVIDNLNGFRLLDRSLRVDHADRYRRPKTDSAAAAGSADSQFLMFEGEEEEGYDQRRLRIWDHNLYPPLPAPAAGGGGGAAGSSERAAAASSAPTSYTVDLTRVGAQQLGEDSSAGRILRLWEEKKRKRQEREAEERRREREEKDRREGRAAASFGDQLLGAARPQPVVAKKQQEPERGGRSGVKQEAERSSSRDKDRRDHRRKEKHSDDDDHRHRRRHRSRTRSRSRSPDRSRRNSGRR